VAFTGEEEHKQKHPARCMFISLDQFVQSFGPSGTLGLVLRHTHQGQHERLFSMSSEHKEDEMDMVCSTHGTNEKRMQNISCRTCGENTTSNT